MVVLYSNLNINNKKFRWLWSIRFYFKLCFMHVCTCWSTCVGQRAVWGSQFSIFTNLWVPEIELRFLAGCKLCYLRRFSGPSLRFSSHSSEQISQWQELNTYGETRHSHQGGRAAPALTAQAQACIGASSDLSCLWICWEEKICSSWHCSGLWSHSFFPGQKDIIALIEEMANHEWEWQCWGFRGRKESVWEESREGDIESRHELWEC